MSRRPWESLVRRLGESGFESPYLERLRARLDVEQAQRDLEAEIRREMASALGRSEDKVNAALLELELIGRDIEAEAEAGPGGDAWLGRVNARVRDYNRQREVARRCLWELVIHREALGFRRNEILRQFYPIPEKRSEYGPRGGGRGLSPNARPRPQGGAVSSRKP